MRPTTLCADAHGRVTLALSPELVAASTETRVIEGLALPFGATGQTTIGPITTTAQSRVVLPEDLRRVKLVDEHRQPPVAIGYATDARMTEAGLVLAFHVGATPEGDAALLQAAEGVRDAFSVELVDLELTASGELVAGTLTAVALVTVPAYADARVSRVAASQNPATVATTDGRIPMTDEQRARLAELIALNSRTPEQEAEYVQLVQLAAAEATPDPAPAPQAQSSEPPASQAAAAATPTAMAAAHPGVPAGLPLPGGRAASPRPIAELYAAMSRVLTGVSRPQMEAALADITQGGNLYVSSNGYEGELWSGVQTERTWVPLMTAGELRNYKGSGWRWVVRPAVADYAGDKADVPSNSPTTENAEWTAARLAGAHDIDRKFWDFGDTEFIASYFEAMRESYAVKSDAKARAFIIANATLATATVPDNTATLFDMALALKLEMEQEDATTGVVAGTPDFYVVNSLDYRALLGTDANSVPAFLDVLGIDPSKFRATASVASGTVVAGVKAASQFKELPGSPIRVETVSISDGGMDGGLFGYYATFLNNASGIKKIVRPA